MWRSDGLRNGGIMRCDTCGKDSAVVQRVVIAKDYDRSMARPLYNCPACYEKKEQSKIPKNSGAIHLNK